MTFRKSLFAGAASLSPYLYSRKSAAFFGVVAVALAAHGQNPTNFGTVAVGSATPATQTVTVPVSASGTVAQVAVLTSGSLNLDYTATASGTDTCTNQTFTAPATCRFSVTFSPVYPGPRYGAVVLRDSAHNVLGMEYLTGVGQGPLGVFLPGAISTVAGTEGKWQVPGDGQAATTAELDLPSGVAVDGAGDLFIADSAHNVVREVSAANGTIEPVAGNYSPGYNSSTTTATMASLNLPGGIALDGAGNLYIADTHNNVVRKVDLVANTIMTLAGNGQAGYAGDGSGANDSTTELSAPSGVAVDAAGNVYIADTGNNAIREISASTGEITTVAGGGTNPAGCTGSTDAAGDGCAATSATLNAPYGVAFDPSGNLYIADSGNDVVREVKESTGIMSTVAGTLGVAGYQGDGRSAAAAQLDSPQGLAFDAAGSLYIADAGNYAVRQVNASSRTITTVAGNNSKSYSDGKTGFGNGQPGEGFSGGGIATGAGIYTPYGIALDAEGDLYVAEFYDHVIREVVANQATLFYYPAVWLDQVSQPQMQTVENDGNAALSFSAIGLPTDKNAQVGTDGTCNTPSGTLLGVGDQCTVSAIFYGGQASSQPNVPVVGTISLTTAQTNSPLTISTINQVLSLNDVTLTVVPTPNPSTYGQTVNVAVTLNVSGTGQSVPSGTVTIYDLTPAVTPAPSPGNPPSVPPGTPVGTGTLANGTVTIPMMETLAVGTHDIYAAYSGDTYYNAANSQAIVEQVTEKVALTLGSSSNPSTLNSPVALTATVSITGNVPTTGTTVSFSDMVNGTAISLGTAPVNSSGIAVLTTSTLPVGSNSITASYTDVNGVSAPPATLTQAVQQQTATAVTSSASPSIYGDPVTFTATVEAINGGTAVPSGSVTFSDGTTTLGAGTLTPVGATAATATFKTSSLAVGTYTITATYSGDSNDQAGTAGSVAQQVIATTTNTLLSVNPTSGVAGGSATLTAVVSSNGATPGGAVSFYSNGALLGSGTLSGGKATFAMKSLAVGTYSLTASYAGDANDGASGSAAVLFSVAAGTTQVTLTASASTANVTTPVTFIANMTSNGVAPTGIVTFMDGTQTLGTGTLNGGVATLTTSSLPLGQQSITAVYAGDANNGAATSSPVTVTVSTFKTQTTLVASATNTGSTQPVVLLATVSSASGKTVTGTVTFMNGSATLGTQPVGGNGAALLTIALTAGNDTVTAQYSGDADDAGSTSSGVAVTVAQAADFSIQLSSTSLSIPTKNYANLNVELNSVGGLADTVALGCSSLPASVTCNFSSADVNLTANGSSSVVLTVDTNSPLAAGSQARNETPNNGILAAFLFPGSALFGFGLWRFRRRTGLMKVMAIVATLAGATLFLNGCGGFSLSSAKAGSYVIQVTATGEKTGVTHVANLSVTVTQ